MSDLTNQAEVETNENMEIKSKAFAPTNRKVDNAEPIKVQHQNLPSTPALAKVRQSRLEFKVQSPSDSLMSPCTKMLAGGGSKKPKSAISHPQNVLRNKQHKDLMRKLPED